MSKTTGRQDLAVLLGLAALALWLFHPALLLGRVFYQRDVHLVWHAQVEAFVRAVLAGSWPLWDPSVSFGQPLLANPNVQALYPLTWLNLLLRPWTVYTVAIVSHSLGSAAGVHLLGRRLGASTAGACAGAALWMLCGPFLSLANVWHHFMGAAWIPWVWWAADRALGSRRAIDGVLWGTFLGLQLLAGSPDMSAMTGLLMAALVLARVRWRAPLDAANRGPLGVAALAALVAVGLSAGQWMPTLEVARRSARWAFPDEVRAYWSVHPLGALEVLFPGLWRGPLRAELSAAIFSGREPFIASLYLGAPALALVAAAFAARARHRWLLAAVGAAALLFALGPRTPFYALVLAAWPPLRLLRYPVKAMVMAGLAWSLLAALGFDGWREAVPARKRWLLGTALPVAAVALACLAGLAATSGLDRAGAALFGGGLDHARYGELVRPFALRLALGAAVTGLAAALAVARRAPSPRLAVAVAVVAVCDLAAFHRNLPGLGPRALFAFRPPILDVVGGPPNRVYVYDYTALDRSRRYLHRPGAFQLARGPADWRHDEAQALAMQMVLAPQTAGRWGLLGSFDIDYLGLYPTPLSLLGIQLRRLEGTPAHAGLLRAGGVDFVVALHEEGFAGLEPAAVLPGLLVDPIRVYRVPGRMPRASVVPGARIVPDAEAYGLLGDPSFDPRREVILDAGAPAAPPEGFRGEAAIERFAPDRLRIATESTHPARLLVLDSYDPGWHATVDGRDAPIARTNVAFRSVEVPAGRHVVEMRYRPAAVVIGLVASALTLLAAIGAAARHAIMAPPHERI